MPFLPTAVSEWYAAVPAPLLAVAMAAGVLVLAGMGWALVRSGPALGRVALDLIALRRRLRPGPARDRLTGLVNRAQFEREVADAARVCDRHPDRALAVLVIGLDEFRNINDGFGRRVGDAVLREAARRLGRMARHRLWVARVAGDEFALLATVPESSAVAAAQRVAKRLGEPYVIDNQSLRLALSIGVACYPSHGACSRLLTHAELAMRQVRQGGGSGHLVFDPVMAVDLRDQAALVQDLRGALERNQLQLVYQPKVDAKTLQITAAEALLRWEHPRRGMVSPAVFVPLAERHGLIGTIGEWVISEACRQAGQWREGGFRMRIAVNLSAHQLNHPRLVPHMLAELARHGVQPSRMTCEITESVAMEDTQQTRAAFERLRKAGLHVSIDDFGTGHSSLAVLRRLPAAELKIDRQFVTDLGHSEEARSIVQAVLSMAHTLGLRVVAEGVETEIQRDTLISLGCDELQGFLFGKPMSAQALALWARNDNVDVGGKLFRPSLFQPTKVPQVQE